jgi:hypothetical protein
MEGVLATLLLLLLLCRLLLLLLPQVNTGRGLQPAQRHADRARLMAAI